ncbi:serine hydrolase [Paraflavitalea speifideaquila]|uniref:serine hydrolase n=1 Tax=Paraflavitalea speifideaquila TaxID=3076558 RepID=UPI0028E2CB48|nr:serine hydrolase [Paraflavitalea speifideiaquila]
MANMELEVSMKENMVFHIGSLTKQFTAVAILQLVEQGKISLQDDIRKYLPNYQVLTDTVTIEHLLTHTSGMASEPDPKAKNKTPDELVDGYKNQPIEFSAGTRWNYNNANYYLLGFIVEKLSGKPYAQYLKENIFTPAGMNNTCFCTLDTVIRNKASGYINGRIGIVNDRISSMNTLYSSGGIQSTAEDMFRWNQAIKANILLKKETMNRAFTPFKLKNGQDSPYGYGWHIQDIQGSRSYRHGGAVSGFVSEELYLPDEDAFVIALFNSHSRIPIGVLSRLMAAMAIEKPYSFKEITLDNKLLKTYAGVYNNVNNELIIITEVGNQLYFQRPGGIRYTINASAKDNFFFDKDYLCVDFLRDSVGNLHKLGLGKVGIGTYYWSKTNQTIPTMLPARLPDSLMQQYVGKYVFSSGDTLTIIKEGLGLVIQPNGSEKLTTYPETEQLFSALKRITKLNLKEIDRDSLINLSGSRVRSRPRPKEFLRRFRQAIAPIDQDYSKSIVQLYNLAI